MLQSLSASALAVCFATVGVVLFYTLSDSEPDNANDLQGAVSSIISYWNESIASPSKPFIKLVVGINSNLDIIVPGVALLKALNVSPGKKKNHDSLNNLSELQETFAQYFSRGSAAERPFLDKEVYQKIIKTAESLDQVEYFVGGNAALIAMKAVELFPNLQVHYVGGVGPKLEKLLPKSIKLDPACHIPKDEVHLIMEYKVGEIWGDSTAPVATRFVTSYDATNTEMLKLESFFAAVKSANFDLMVLSGLHLMDAQSPELFKQRLDQLVTLLHSVPETTASHLEMASMANQQFVKQIVEQVLPNVNSIGLNEQELVFLSKSCKGPNHDMFDRDNHGQPEIHKISDILLWVMKNYGHSEKTNQSHRLSRIHFHSLTYHIIAVLESKWSNTESAVAAGAQIAGLQAGDVPELDEDLVDLRMPSKFKTFSGEPEQQLSPEKPVVSWRKDGILFVLSPVLVCKHPVKTVGLGDAISARGLMFSQYNSLL